MPMYYDCSLSFTSSATAGSQATASAAKLLTGASVDAMVKGVYIGCRMSTAGGGLLRVITAGTAPNPSGSTVTPSQRNSDFAPPITSAVTATTRSPTATPPPAL